MILTRPLDDSKIIPISLFCINLSKRGSSLTLNFRDVLAGCVSQWLQYFLPDIAILLMRENTYNFEVC